MCTSTHLTPFAVLVDTTGALEVNFSCPASIIIIMFIFSAEHCWGCEARPGSCVVHWMRCVNSLPHSNSFFLSMSRVYMHQLSDLPCWNALLCVSKTHCRKNLLAKAHNFVHLNLALSLLLANLVFISGIDTATGNEVNLQQTSSENHISNTLYSITCRLPVHLLQLFSITYFSLPSAGCYVRG